MFNLFKKKKDEIKIIDKVVMSDLAKLDALYRVWESDKETIFIFWFDETLNQASSFFSAKAMEAASFLTAREASSQFLTGKKIIFAEHYPLHSKEEHLYEQLKLETVTVYSSLTEALFHRFGADKIIALMKQMGIKENEVIEHKMITKSVRSAQEKIEKELSGDRPASSQTDWMEKNLPGE